MKNLSIKALNIRTWKAFEQLVQIQLGRDVEYTSCILERELVFREDHARRCPQGVWAGHYSGWTELIYNQSQRQ